eukprot:CAMPEP_0119110478 /NCGR_PEP_ID=MMETSP1180-20130426/29909_1 /TAXON_ID=3052 ORGANISM="Chlamydomonas cf sp, Strain CCMP681" /NCGR_SAMPLE_ID=MMETSP1180 /ASSEMBLY_ACC=CAM_ASM_000741 /LENGTH=494 /DNA_ID=CAMNT_0007096833 /DNA_START=45 /DNA_END=1529 /DNA_ORIENTATION=-
MTAQETPTYTSLEHVYAEHTADAMTRYQEIQDRFIKLFDQKQTLVARAPGRVNLIGEHIDYEGYGVLPMAINQDTIVAIAKGGDQIVVSNLDQERYATHSFPIDPSQAVDTHHHSWANYMVCAYKGAFELIASKGLPTLEPCGLQILVHGVVPQGAGLSSSAAFVCAGMVAVLAVHGVTCKVTKAEVAEYAARAERYVGVTAGGMDQAISLMAVRGVAMLINFNPVRAQDVLLPEGATFVIANSLTVSNKAEGAHKRYNLRVIECRLAAAMLSHNLGMPQDFCTSIKTLQGIEPVLVEKSGSGSLVDCAAAARKHLHEAVYTHDEVETALGMSLDSLFKDSEVALKVVSVARELGGFKLLQRAVHVFEEAQRVCEVKAVCESDIPAADKRAQLGKLMNASHASCSELYECSSPQLEDLTAQARAAGALGSRLTGAGWGGCTVSLVPDEVVPHFLKTLHEGFYASLLSKGLVDEADMPNVLFATRAAAGAAVLVL